MRSRLFLLLLVLFLMLAALHAAPAPKHADTLVGELRYGGKEGPIVWIGVQEGETLEYWLVFTSPEIEKQATKFVRGDRVKVTGTLGAGGGWRYVVVASIGKDE